MTEIDYFLTQMNEISRVPKTVMNQGLVIPSENTWNKWIKNLNKFYERIYRKTTNR